VVLRLFLVIFAQSKQEMQFRHPELLWALLLLLIPIFIHLFQLRRFKKTPFTNVALLQKVVSSSRRSNTIKKWLLLFARMSLLAAIVVAFAQPFLAEKSALKKKETTIYVDDSFSMQAKSGNSTLLQNAIQELIQAAPETGHFNLFTNEREFRNITIKDIQNELLSLSHSSKQLSFDEIELKGKTFFSSQNDTRKELILISDFQRRIGAVQVDSITNSENHLVQMVSDGMQNISLDTVYINQENLENIEIEVLISGTSESGNIPVSLFNGELLIAKTAAETDEKNKGVVNFSIPNKDVIDGRVEVSDTGLSYDNVLHFNINKKEKIKILSIGNGDTKFLERIFTDEEFEFTSNSINSLNYSDIESRNLIILNELTSIPASLQTSLKSFKSNGGSLVVIPSVDIDFTSYNQFLVGLSNTSFVQNVNYERKITNIDFSHPLYRNVFEKKVSNFQYPMVKKFKRIKTTASSILSFQDKDPFLVGTNGVYIFTASISNENSNFKNSPLIVPTLYNVGIKSLETPKLYSLVGSHATVDIPVQLSKDDILIMKKSDYEFIPQQRSYANKVTLRFTENPKEDGIYSISDKQKTYQNLSFNHPRDESDLSYIDLSTIESTSKSSTIKDLFDALQKDSSITELWKWFVILALLFLMIEILIQKFLK